jgi:hypothetical protein
MEVSHTKRNLNTCCIAPSHWDAANRVEVIPSKVMQAARSIHRLARMCGEALGDHLEFHSKFRNKNLSEDVRLSFL